MQSMAQKSASFRASITTEQKSITTQRPRHTSYNHPHLPLINRQRWQQPYGLAPRHVDQQPMIPRGDEREIANRLFQFDPIINPCPRIASTLGLSASSACSRVSKHSP